MSVPPDRPHDRAAARAAPPTGHGEHPHRPARPGARAFASAGTTSASAGAALASLALALLGGCSLLQPEAGRRDPAVEQLRSDDDLARIEATRVRGQTGAVTVTPHAASAPAYQVLPPGTGDASQRRGAEGQRVWPVLQF
jgi:hypothetical protein